MIKGKKILITGGAGFIGVSIIEKLIEDNEVIVADINLTKNAIQYSNILNHRNLKTAGLNILDKNNCNNVISGDINIVIHLAAKLGVQHILNNSSQTLNVNYVGTLNVLNASMQLKNLERFIFFSTSEVFGSNAYQIIENGNSVLETIENKRWCYSLSKLAAEHLAFSYFREKQMPVVVIRPFNIFGPQRVGDNVTRRFILNALTNKDLTVYGDGAQIRSWCYIDDFTTGVVSTLDEEKAIGEAFNIGNAFNVITAYNLAKTVIDICSSKSKIVFKEIDFRDIDIRVPDIKKASRILGYNPKIDLDTGLERTTEWFKNNLESLNN
jgi:nucleoside-diphosphate-sugar epimerase